MGRYDANRRALGDARPTGHHFPAGDANVAPFSFL
jgi:hypothetical protein